MGQSSSSCSGYFLQLRPHSSAEDQIRLTSSTPLPFICGQPFTGGMRLVLTDDIAPLLYAPTGLVAAARARCHVFQSNSRAVLGEAAVDDSDIAGLEAIDTQANEAATAAVAQHSILVLHKLHFNHGRLIAVDDQPADVIFVDLSSPKSERNSSSSRSTTTTAATTNIVGNAAILPSLTSSPPLPTTAANVSDSDTSLPLDDVLRNLDHLEELGVMHDRRRFAPSTVPLQPIVFVLRLSDHLTTLKQLRSHEHHRTSASSTTATPTPSISSSSSSSSSSATESIPRLFLHSDWQLPGSREYDQHFTSHSAGSAASFRMEQRSRGADFRRHSDIYVLHASRPHAHFPTNQKDVRATTKAHQSYHRSLPSLSTDSSNSIATQISNLTEQIWAEHQAQRSSRHRPWAPALDPSILKLQRFYAVDDDALWREMRKAVDEDLSRSNNVPMVGDAAVSVAATGPSALSPETIRSAPKLSHHFEHLSWDVDYWLA